MFHKHTILYDTLPDWFIAFDLYDKATQHFIPLYKAKKQIELAKIQFVPILYNGIIKNHEHIKSFITKSCFSSNRMEGVVLHDPETDVRCKYVTKKFQESMDNSIRWMKDDRTKNILLNQKMKKG